VNESDHGIVKSVRKMIKDFFTISADYFYRY